MDRYVGPGSVGLQWGERLKVCGFERGGRHPRVGSGLVNLPGLPERRLERLDGDFDTIGAGHRSRSSDNTQASVGRRIVPSDHATRREKHHRRHARIARLAERDLEEIAVVEVDAAAVVRREGWYAYGWNSTGPGSSRYRRQTSGRHAARFLLVSRRIRHADVGGWLGVDGDPYVSTARARLERVVQGLFWRDDP